MAKRQKASYENSRVKVGKLGQQNRELKIGEAKNVRGGGGASGGVLGDRGDGRNQRPAQ